MDSQAFDFLGLGQGIADHALLQAMPVAVYTTDEAGRITFYNEAAARTVGMQAGAGARTTGADHGGSTCPTARRSPMISAPWPSR